MDEGANSDNESEYWSKLFDGVIEPEEDNKVEEKEDIKESEFRSEEGVKARGAPRPVKPSKADVAEHELTHIPYRDWCVHCRRASGRCGPHYSKNTEQKEEERHGAIGAV